MSKPREPSSSDITAPSEIPTALESSPFTGDRTLDATQAESETPAPTPSTGTGAETPAEAQTPERPVDKFRRPTQSEIMRAVDQVNTESVDMEALAKARAEQQRDDEDDEDPDDAVDESLEIDIEEVP